MKHISIAVSRTKRYESILKNHFGCVKDGFFKRIEEAEGQLPKPLLDHLKFIGAIRNNLAHDESKNSIQQPTAYVNSVNYIEELLSKRIPNFEKSLLSLSDLDQELPQEKIVYITQPAPPPIKVIEKVHVPRPIPPVLAWCAAVLIALALGCGMIWGFYDPINVSGETEITRGFWPIKWKEKVLTETTISVKNKYFYTLIIGIGLLAFSGAWSWYGPENKS